MNKTIGATVIMMMGSALIAGCGASTAHPSAQGASSTPSKSTSSSPSTSSSASSSPSTSPSTSVSSTSIPVNSSPSTSTSSSSSSVAPQATSSSGVSLVKDWMQAGLNGEGVNMPIGDGKTIGLVQNEWGQGKLSSAGAGVYDVFSTHDVSFGVGTGNQIFDVTSNAPNVQQITRADVTSTLGTPGAVRYADNTTIYMYPDGPNYQVLWTFPGGPGKTGNTVDHVSVYWPQGTVDLMGQTVPNPSVTVSASTASALSFTIKNAPSGYRLDEIEWLPTKTGTTVVNTHAQAAQNAGHGNSGADFTASSSGYQLQFPTSMRGTSGQIRLIYESTQGSAIIGTSNTITLN